jgi:pSer/pThr/pTyr-binding forkhead associated (FHA) protein
MADIPEDPKSSEPTPEPEARVPDGAFLILEGTKAFQLDQPVIKIGRSHENTIVLDDPRVSRHHVEIRVIREHFVLFDLGSSGGTFVNGQRINQGLLYPGDLISLAGINLVFMQGTHLPGQSRFDQSGTMPGPGQRPTVVFDTSIFTKKKKRPW